MKIKKLDHLSEVHSQYEAYLIDLWGVIHNGIRLNEPAIKAVSELEKKGKKITFLSNAPRPAKMLLNF